MNSRPDLLRQNNMAQQAVLNLPGHFMPPNPQTGPANANNPHGPMAMLGVGASAPSNPTPAMNQRYQPNLLSGPPPRPSMMLRQGQNGPMNPNIAGGTAAGTPMSMQNVSFPAGMGGGQGAQPVRRASSNNHINQNPMVARMGVAGMPQGVGNNIGNMGMGMNPQANMPAQIRAHHLQQQLSGHMSSEMAGSGMNRSGPAGGPGGGPGGSMGGGIGVGGMGGGGGPNISRPNPGLPLMHSLPQPTASLTGPSGIGMPGGPHQNNFQNMPNLQHPHQHPSHQQHGQTPQLTSSSPRPGSHHGGPTHASNLSMGAPGPSQPPLNRTPMTPDNNNGYPNFNNGSQFPPGPGPGGAGNRVASGGMVAIGDNGGNGGGGNNAYPYVPSTPPNSNPNPMVVDPQSLPGSLAGTPSGTPNRPGFTLTPAQQLQMGIDGSVGNASGYRSFPVAPNNVPPRPPSQSQTQLQHNVNSFASHSHPSHSSHPSHPPHPSQQTSLPQHPSPHPNDLMTIYPPVGSGPSPGRPQSQNQNHSHPGRSPSQAVSSHTPRPGQAAPPSGMHPGPVPVPGRLPQGRPQSSNGLMPGQSSGPSQLPNIAPRPPPPGSAPGSSTGPHPPGHPSAIQPSASAPPMAGPSSHPGTHPPHLGPGPHPPSHPESSSPSSATPPGQTNPDSQPPPTGTVSGGVPNFITGGAPTTVIPRAVGQTNHPVVGQGQGLIRLLQFSGNLASESKQKLQLSWWSELIREYFTPKATMRFTLWKDNQKNEAKVFEIGVPILPRFFLVTTQSGVKSMTLTLDGARERLHAYGHAIVECVTAVWTYKYNNGYTVALRGPLTVHVVVTAVQPPAPGATSASGIPTGGNYMLKFDDFQFDATLHDKYIALESIMGGPRVMENPRTPRVRNNLPPGSSVGSVTGPGGASAGVNGVGPNGSEDFQDQEEEKKWEEPRVMIERGFIPGEPVNAFGIPQATMRCLELAESVAQMTDLIAFSSEHGLGPLEALSKMAAKIRDSMPPNQSHINQSQPLINGVMNPNTNFNAQPTSQSGFPSFSSSSAPSTLYSSAPSSVTNPSSAQTPSSTMASTNSPQNTPSSANNSPRKQHKTIPQQSTGGSSSTAPSTSSNPASTTNTPAMANASLKRKQVTESPASTHAEQHPPSKRANRKRRTTGGER